MKSPSTQYIDCNAASWEVQLIINQSVFFYSARAAALVVYGEADKQAKERRG